MLVAFNLCRGLELHYSHRQSFANAAIAASRVGSLGVRSRVFVSVGGLSAPKAARR